MKSEKVKGIAVKMESNINAPSFRTSVGGYNRNDVNNYIMEINSRFTEALHDSEEKIRHLEIEIEKKDIKIKELSKSVSKNISGDDIDLSAKSTSAHSNRIFDDFGGFYRDIVNSDDDVFDKMTPVSELAKRISLEYVDMASDKDDGTASNDNINKISELTAKLEESEALITALNERISKLREQYDDVNEQLAASRERVDELEKKTEPSEIIIPSEDEKNKAVMYDKLASQIGEIILDAQQTADALVKNATRHAEDIISRADASLAIARESADSIINDAEKRSTERIELADSSIKESIEHFKSQIMTAVNGYFQTIDSVANDLSSDAIKNYSDKVISEDKISE